MMLRYKTITAIGHPIAGSRGRVLEHRKIWYDHFGSIAEGFVVHHKNGNKLDNRIENLEAMSRAAHMKEHYSEGLGVRNGIKEFARLQCAVCSKVFERPAHGIRANNKLRKTANALHSCDRKCWSTLANAYRNGTVAKYEQNAMKVPT